MRRIDAAKDAIDDAINGVEPKRVTQRSIKARLARAKDLAEYIELHHTSQLEEDLEAIRRDRKSPHA